MIFNTWIFGVFAVVCIASYWTIVPRRWRAVFLVASGIVFYAWSVPAYTLLVGLLGLLTYVIGNRIARSGRQATRKALLIVGVVMCAGVLVTFKYTRFLALTVDQIASRNVVPVPQLTVPLAISFFTFEFVHVLVDAYYRKITILRPVEFATFTMFFPTLVAGPIKRYQSFAPQVEALQAPTGAEVSLNLYRIAIGLFKKSVLADSMTPFAQAIVAPTAISSQLDFWVGMLAYTAKIYFDFSGYSDIAIGIAGIFGYAIPENFRRPYWSRDIATFWGRWHISLSSWIRDYVFIPLGGSRRPPAVVLLNLLLAMIVSGLWHGAAWTFVLWGLWHGVGLAVHRLWSRYVASLWPARVSTSQLYASACVALTFSFVAAGWVLFAANSPASAQYVYTHLLRP